MSIPEFNPPDKKLVEDLIKPFQAWFDPKIYGFDKLEKDKPALYIRNHTIYGLTDGFYLGAKAYLEKDIFMRALVDNMHMHVPVWRRIIEDLGMIPADRDNCTELMQAGQHVMVFPGGSREAFKNKGEDYQLMWKQRLGFAKMAIANNYDIIPVAAVGGDDMYTILWDSHDLMNSSFGQWLKKSGWADKYLRHGELIPPIAKGIGITGLPRPERIYIKVGDRIDTSAYNGDHENPTVLMDLRKEVEASMNEMIYELKAYRRNDTDQEWWRKLLNNMK